MKFDVSEIIDSAEIAHFTSLKGKGGSFEEGIFIAEGPKVVEVTLRSPCEILTAFLTKEHWQWVQPLVEFRSDEQTLKVILAPKERMEAIVGYSLHQGVMLAVSIPESPSLRELINSLPNDFLIVALDGVTDAENMGAIIRTAAAFGAHALLVDKRSCNPYLRRSIRVSMGTIANLAICRIPDLADALRHVRTTVSAQIVGTGIGEQTIQINEMKWAPKTVLVFGSEGFGISKAVQNECDLTLGIPMAGTVDSLNVAIASGIFLFEWSIRKFN